MFALLIVNLIHGSHYEFYSRLQYIMRLIKLVTNEARNFIHFGVKIEPIEDFRTSMFNSLPDFFLSSITDSHFSVIFYNIE